METVEESAVLVSYENVKENASKDELVSDATDEVQPTSKTNGIAPEAGEELKNGEKQCTESTINEITHSVVVESETTVVEPVHLAEPDKSGPEVEKSNSNSSKPDEILNKDSNLREDSVADTSSENVSFETEVVVEKDGSEILDDVENSVLIDLDSHHIELNAAIISSAEVETLENNNSTCKSEVMNNEELLDILQGNDVDNSTCGNNSISSEDTAKLALEQLTQLSRKQTPKKRQSNQQSNESYLRKPSGKQGKKRTKSTSDNKEEKVKAPEQDKEEIVSALFKDWDDDEMDTDADKNVSEAPVEKDGKNTSNAEQTPKVDVPSIENEETAKLADNSVPQRRLGRVIKKKVIFDPDNPDTFTKSKSTPKGKELSHSPEKEPSPAKKVKTEQQAAGDTSKSPAAKSPWKKPTPKANKNSKRLTEVDRLLMDEGAVNMIYQLTPEASKGKKNMQTKAELIKQINQSSTPEQKEKKFRERKIKTEDLEAKKITGSKMRSSSSVKSSACEEFDAHSADDSIIYRRHSSSSYSSTCMSPRRLSEIDIAQNISVVTQPMESMQQPKDSCNSDVFMAETETIIRKEDCLSLKEKLNSKLSNILNKRTIDSPKTEKAKKQKKRLPKLNASHILFDTVALHIDQNVATISFVKSGRKETYITLKMLQELEIALEKVNERSDSTVTLLYFDPAEIFSSGVYMHPLLEENIEKRTTYAFEITNAVRNVLKCLKTHRKLLVGCVSGLMVGVGLSMLALCDVSVAAESASFAFASGPNAVMMPGVSLIASNYKELPRNLVTDLVMFGRRLSALEACREGLVSRTLISAGFHDQVTALARDFASQPPESVLMKKRLLNIMSKNETEIAKFTSTLTSEQDLFVEYWTSVSGQERLRNLLEH